jgi:nitrite reductase/ring-hydroxylating ferredoxin subunit
MKIKGEPSAECQHSPDTLKFDWPGAPQPGTVLCALKDLQDGDIRCMNPAEIAGSCSPSNQGFGLLLLRSGTNVKAFLNRCAHFGVPLSQDRAHLIFEPHQTLTCNVHYAKYRWIDGLCISGDCLGESLTALPVQVNAAGMVEIAGR